jgi:adenylate kinase
MNIIILGPQGSGKGTQANLLAKKLNLFYFDMGKFLREEAKNNSTLDEIVNKKGGFVPEDMSTPLALKYIEERVPERDNIIFDGVPRSKKQNNILEEWLREKAKKIDWVILLEVPEGVSIDRLSARRMCKKCGNIYNLITEAPPTPDKCSCGGELYQREDDYPEAIKKRLSWYRELTEPLLKDYESRGILIRVNGEKPVEEIFKDILAKLGADNEAK